jgi:hypothetical protein
MRMRSRGVWSWLPTAALGLGVAFGPGGAAAELYAWKTDDGAYAFTDDQKAIPDRYRDRVEVQPSGNIRGYERFTPKDDEASRSYEARLARRLEHLRALNASFARQGAAEPVAAGGERVALRTGRDSGPSIEITSDPTASGEPIVVETIFMRRDGSAVVQPVRITRRGEQILAVEMPRDREWNVATDVYDESELRDRMGE